MKTPRRSHSGKHLTAAADRAQGSFGGTSVEWQTLSDEEYSAWAELAKQENRRLRRKGRKWTAHDLFMKLNSHQRLAGLPGLRHPSARPSFGQSLPTALEVTVSNKGTSMRLFVPEPPDGHILVYASPPFPPGRHACHDFRFIGVLPPLEDDTCEIAELYVARFGDPPPGARVFVQVQQQVDGWRSPFFECSSAIVQLRRTSPPRRGG